MDISVLSIHSRLSGEMFRFKFFDPGGIENPREYKVGGIFQVSLPIDPARYNIFKKLRVDGFSLDRTKLEACDIDRWMVFSLKVLACWHPESEIYRDEYGTVYRVVTIIKAQPVSDDAEMILIDRALQILNSKEDPLQDPWDLGPCENEDPRSWFSRN